MYMVFSNMVTWTTAAHYASCFVLLCNLYRKLVKIDVANVLIRVAEWPLFGKQLFIQFTCVIFVGVCQILYVSFFPFWCWRQDVGCDCIDSWSLPFYSRTSMARTLMARLPRLFRTHSWVRWKKAHSGRYWIVYGVFLGHMENGILCALIRISSMRRF